MAIEFKIKINGTWVDKSQNVQLPINITQSIDDTMDRGEVTLNFTQDMTEYEPYSFIYLVIEGREYYMMVEQDAVEEIQNGVSSYFKHDISIVEATQFLATMDTNDFSITQDVNLYFEEKFSLKDEFFKMPYNDNFFQGENLPAQWRVYGTAFTFKQTFLGSGGYGGIYKVNAEFDNTQFLNKYTKDTMTHIQLPRLIDASFYGKWERRLLSFAFSGVQVGSDEEKFSLGLDITLRNKTTNQILNLTNLVDNNNRINLDLLANGEYEYRVRAKAPFYDHPSNTAKLNSEVKGAAETWLDMFQANDYTLSGGINYQTDRLFDYSYSFQVVNTSTDTFNITLAEVMKKALNNTTTRTLTSARYWRSISQEQYNSLPFAATLPPAFLSFPEPNVAFGNAETYEYTTRALLIVGGASLYYRVDSLIAQGTLDMTNFDTTLDSLTYYTKRLAFKFDQEILDRAAAIHSLDYTFTGGKNLLEIMFELGKTLGGVPRVYFDANLDPVISFDILEELPNNPNFVDTFTTMKKTANTSNYATNVITEVNNFIMDDDIGVKSTNVVVYPSLTSWVTPRAVDYDAALMRPDNMALSIDDPNHGIYIVTKLFVTNFDDNNSIEDISAYVHEKKVFDTFENALQPAGVERLAYKGIALYYQRGSNQILNINEITNPDNVFGISGTKYTIRRILLDIINPQTGQPKYTNAQLTKPEVTYQYRIHYVPMIKKARLFVEQSNVTLETQSINMPFNQTERNISLSQYFKAADIALKRNGIPSIRKNYVFQSFSQVPFMGQEIDFDGYQYFADKITTSYDNNNIVCEVQYSRNVNRVDPDVGFKKEYREYSILADNIVWKRMNLNNYIYISGEDTYSPRATFDGSKAYLVQSVVNSMDNGQFPSTEKIASAVFNYYDKDGKLITWNSGDEKVKPLGMSLITSAAGNSLMFSSSMYDNFSAGRKMVKIPYNQANATDQVEGLVSNDGFDNERNRLSQDYIRYVDDDGKAGVARVIFLKESDTLNFDPLKVPELQSNYKDFPSKAVLDETFIVDKDNREAIQFVYQLHAVSRDKDIEIKPALMRHNKTVSNVSSLPVAPASLIMVGINDYNSLRNETFYEYATEDVLEAPVLVQLLDNKRIGLIGTTRRNTKNKTYQGVALVYAGTKEIAILKKKTLNPNDLIGAIFMAFSEELL